jgi:TetR/AcrR family transcriptional regulator, transcriptional repressor for nem operon
MAMGENVKRQEILDVGTELIAMQGYNNTGIERILRQAGVPKGSFYHYFRSKEEFGLAVIDQFAEQYDQNLRSHLQDHSLPPLLRLRNYFEQALLHLSQCQFTKGCLVGNLGQELADQNERFRQRLEVIFQSWKDHFGTILIEAQERGDLSARHDPAMLAEFILASWEGAILRAKVMKSPQAIRTFIDTLFATVLTPP